MELIDNISRLLGDDLKQTLRPGARLKIAASCFSMYAFEALKAELEKIDELDFIFTSPTFVANEVTDKIRKERKEFHIPKLDRERSLYGSEFEIQLRNKLTCCKGQDKPIVDVCQRFNQETADGRRMQPYSDLLGKSIRSMIEVKEEKDLDSLFSGGKTTALTDTISGLDDFELISFLVIQEAG
jgi:hypothetical protein